MGKENEDISRRRFFLLAGWGGFLAVIGGSILAGIRFMVPTVLFESPRSFKLDKLDAFTEGATTYVEEHKIFILREKESLRCLSAICTHLGCTVSWDEMSGRFLCPCHGSIFGQDGNVLDGPAPRPLEWVKVALTGDGKILVDKGQIVDSQYYYEV